MTQRPLSQRLANGSHSPGATPLSGVSLPTFCQGVAALTGEGEMMEVWENLADAYNLKPDVPYERVVSFAHHLSVRFGDDNAPELRALHDLLAWPFYIYRFHQRQEEVLP